MAPDGNEAREQDGGQMFAGRLARDGYVPRVHGWLYPELASAQPLLQRDGGPTQSQLNGLSIAPVLRPVSASTASNGFRVGYTQYGLVQCLVANMINDLRSFIRIIFRYIA